MKFIDTAKIKISSGAGGNGIIAWRREKYEPRGGPAGGDGGRGGSVFLEADSNLGTLLDFKYKSVYKACDGEKGGPKNQTGKSGSDLIIKVPCGTVIKDAGTKEIIADFIMHGERVLVAEGGRGGRGNARFTSSTRQSPHFCEPGEPSIERELELELKLIAEAGIIGLPNAGKSTLISVISSARPKIADYPFTTLTPNLGVVKKPDGDGVVVADIPGLIKGASEGIGLGHDFIKHIERTRVLIHIIDASLSNGTSPFEAYKIIQNELKKYDKALLEKKQILVLNKIDLLTEVQCKNLASQFKKNKLAPVLISAVTGQNIKILLNKLFKILNEVPGKDDAIIQTFYDPKATDHHNNDFNVYKAGKKYYVEGERIDGLVSVTNLKDFQSVARLIKVLISMGVFKELEKINIQEGDIVYISGIRFEYNQETLIEL